ncbi:glycoside hydrolase family 12 protein [Gelatoporia subvermispora B]|uniref:Glycoside hydrolase family 12 protein n=1 Tax=Ceriporiopsis subvermispora (strain B) TaxID=914234 RepID=M2R4N1_CERS8|nr:glycoside hydrolase family 12 protein [Gelatoporia subvermispora B]
MAFFAALFALALAGCALARPTASTLTGAFTCVDAADFTLCQNQWGAASGVGSQNSTLLSASGDSISWSTVYTWENGPNNVKTYANVQQNVGMGVQLSDLASVPTTWQWTYESQSDGLRADVSYDIWTGVPPTGTAASRNSSFEIMIWLSGLGGIQPVGSQTVTNVSIAGFNWNVWKGPNANWETISLVSADGDITDFQVDLKDFFDYLIAEQGVASTQFLQVIQTGTEAFEGQASLLISNFSVAVNPQ